MIKQRKMPKGSIKVNQSYEGASIEKWIRKAVAQGEPIEEGIPAVFPEHPDKVDLNHDIRADKFGIAQDSLSAVDKAKAAKNQGSVESDAPAESKAPDPSPESKKKKE